MAFAFGQIRVRIARDYCGRNAIALSPKASLIPPRPFLHRLEKALIKQLGKRAAPVVPDSGRLWTDIRDERGQKRPNVKTPARAELLKKVAGPI